MYYGKQDIIYFGKYKGHTIEYILKKDPYYLEWVINNTGYLIDKETKKELRQVINEIERDDNDYSWHDAYDTYRYGD